MICFDDFINFIENTALQKHVAKFQAILQTRYYNRIHGDHHLWQAAYQALPDIDAESVSLNEASISISRAQPLDTQQRRQLIDALRPLHPWRKGPFSVFDVFIDTEWRSDWKWQRIAPHISDLTDRYVLDVGCGSGYHCWRMRGAGAKLVVGIDPSQKLLYQFNAIKKYIGSEPVFFLPLRSEDLPRNMQSFDTVFSLGVLYHRASPFEHLDELKQALKPGGELVLETLTISGAQNTVLVPKDRYAMMRNVWFIPSAATLIQWLERSGFVDIKVVDVNQTSLAEQRSTDWMRFHSLEQFLAPDDINKTIEGYPAPMRTTLTATKP